MQSVVLAGAGRETAFDRAAVIFQHIRKAIGRLASVDDRNIESLEVQRGCPGLRQVRLPQKLIVVDRMAHIDLADFQKRSIFTEALDVDAPEVDIEKLVWSSVNTSRALALNAGAWASLQALPIDAVSYHPMPPIRMNALRQREGSLAVRIICHGAQPAAPSISSQLARAGFAVSIDNTSWNDEAAIHLHVGADEIDDDKPRLIDSWASGRLVVEHIGEGAATSAKSSGTHVSHEFNGFYCPTVGDVISACVELQGDPIFQTKLMKAAHQTAAPHEKDWDAIADAVFA